MKKLITICLLVLIGITNANAQTGCWKQIATGAFHTMGIKNDGTLWAWGNNAWGQLGDGTYINRTSPIQIGTANNWATVSAGLHHTIAIKIDGTLWAWGENLYNQLGDGTNGDKNTPTQIGTSNNWLKISCGGNHTIAIKTNGTLWAWGQNSWGQLGDGTYNGKDVPTQIGTATNWASISTLSTHNLALKNDGSLWAWGYNDDGQLGDATNTGKNTPTQIGSATNWAIISAGGGHSMAIKNNGTLWAWGWNEYGVVDSTYNDVNIPTQVGNATNWTNIKAGANFNIAIRNGGELWGWGRNNNGQIPDNTGQTWGIHYSIYTHTRIGTASDWSIITDRTAIKADGSLWLWGFNGFGQLGDGSNVDKYVPTAISCPNTIVCVNGIITMPSITGVATTCVGSQISLGNTITGGVWSSLNNRATVDAATGIVTGASQGTASIQYKFVSGSCVGKASATFTVNSLPLTPNISYASGTNISSLRSGANFCANRTFTLTGSPAGGVWSKTGVISVNNAGLVNTGNSAGAASVTYTYTDANSCSSSRTIASNVVVCASRGRQESVVNSLWSIFPNPTHSIINLKVETLIGAGSLVVTDLYGKQLLQQPLSMGNNSIDVSKYAKGMYLVSVITEGGKETRKVIVE